MADEKQLQGKVVVITGASSGFGKGAARKFAQNGASVVLAARRDQLLQELQDELEAAGSEALVVHTDVGRREEVEHLLSSTLSRFGRVDIWVNNAGSGAFGLFDETPLDDHLRVIETDLIGVIYGSYCAIKQFRRQGAGTLINMASVAGKTPHPYFSSYAAAKHGVVGLTGSIREELKQEKIDTIRVCLIEPTSFDTPFFEHAASHTGHQAAPIPPVYDPQDVADTIVRLAINPKDEVQAGAAGAAIVQLHQWFPGLAERLMGNQTHSAVIEKAPPAEPTEGNLHAPSESVGGTEVTGGWRK